MTPPTGRPAAEPDLAGVTSRPGGCPGARPDALCTQQVSKSFGAVHALREVSLTVPTGSFYGLVGPNGAGKTTLLSLLTGTMRPDAGRISCGGHDLAVEPERVKELIGVVPDLLAVPERLTGREVLEFTGGMRGLSRPEVADRADSLLHAVGLAPAQDRLVAGYSAGMRKKLGLINALLHRPQVLLLDEPLEAVDPVSAAVIQELLSRYVASGRTVVFSSHVMALVELLCDHVAVISGGRVVDSGPLTEVLDDQSSLQRRFLQLLGADAGELAELSWLLE